MQKAKKYDWKDSNMALFGTDAEKSVKKESAESEPAWQGAGQAPGVKIWRIVKFQVTDWEQSEYGSFYSGDSYVILNTYETEDGTLDYDVHFWIGKYSSQDEYGTAAYKTVELDTFLDDKPIQHREVQGHEGDLFRSYFDCLSYVEGGADSGFRRVIPEDYEAKLFHVNKDGSGITVKQVGMKKANLNSEDVFIFDQGNNVFQFNGAKCSPFEKNKAASFISELNGARGGAVNVTNIEESEVAIDDLPFAGFLSDDPKKEKPAISVPTELYRLSDADGSLDKEKVAEGDAITKDSFTSDDVYLFIHPTGCFVWVGKNASVDERRNGLPYACNHLNGTDYPFLPVTVVTEGKEHAAFNACF